MPCIKFGLHFKMTSKQEQQRKRVYEFYLANCSEGKTYTVNHFLAEKMPKRTIYDIITRAELDSGHQRVQGSGRPARIMTKTNVKRLKTLFDHKDSISQRQAANRFKCNQSHISKTLKKKTAIRARKKTTIPKRNEQQRGVAQTKCARLHHNYGGRDFIMDDESYFTLAHSSIGGNATFYTSNITETPATVKFSFKEKYQPKLLVWMCFSAKGFCRPFFMQSGGAVNQKIYLKKCIQDRLMPFITEHHSDGNYVFWPDLASSHYAKTVTSYFRDNGVHFVAKEDNPANLPECRPIEDFWSILKSMVYKDNWQAENLPQLRRRIEYCIKKLDPELIQRLAREIPKRIDFIRRHDLIENR